MSNHSPSYGSNSVAAATMRLRLRWNLLKTKNKATVARAHEKKWLRGRRRRPAGKMFGGIYNLREAGLRSRICRLAAVRVKGLIKIDPEDAGEIGNRRRQWQEQDDCPEHIFRDPPAGCGPQRGCDPSNDHQGQPVADVHRAQKI